MKSLLPTFAGSLHPFIAERIKKLGKKKSGDNKGKFVLYWMSTAVRDHENPALDVAHAEAAARELPLIIVSFLLGEHTHPTHRRYKFLLEGLKDVQSSFKSKVASTASTVSSAHICYQDEAQIHKLQSALHPTILHLCR